MGVLVGVGDLVWAGVLVIDGVIDGVTDEVGVKDGVIEGVLEGVIELVGVIEGVKVGVAVIVGVIVGVIDGVVDGVWLGVGDGDGNIISNEFVQSNVSDVTVIVFAAVSAYTVYPFNNASLETFVAKYTFGS